MIDDGVAAAAIGAGVAGASHHVGRRLVRPQAVQQCPEVLTLRWVDHVIGVEPERVIAGGVGERLVPCGGEVIDPGELEHAGPEFPGDFHRPVDAPRIDDDDLIEDPPHRLEALRQVLLLVSDDHGQADADFPFPLAEKVPEGRRSAETRLPVRAGSSPAGADLRFPLAHSRTAHPVINLPGKRALGFHEKAWSTRPGLQRDRRPRGVSWPHLAANRRAFSSSRADASMPLPTKVRLPK